MKKFGRITLPVIPDGSSYKFRKLSNLDSVDDTQQCLLDNLWNTRRDTRQFLDSINSLSIYFDQVNVSQQTRDVFFSSSSGGVSPDPPLASISNSNFSDLSDRYNKLLDENIRLKATVINLARKLKKSPFTPLVEGEKSLSSPLDEGKSVSKSKRQSSPLDDGESVSENMSFQVKTSKVLALPKAMSVIPESLPPEITSHIQYLARAKGHHFQEFLFQTLSELASQQIPGLSIIWDTLYYQEQDRVNCPSTNPLCVETPLERMDCPCQLIFSIPKACIDMEFFQDLSVKFQGEEVKITPMTLLDYGFLRQVIFVSPEQTDRVNRKLAVCVNNILATRALQCQVLVKSKMPEWTVTGNVILAQHVMNISSHRPFSRNFGPVGLARDDSPWPCSKPARCQIISYRAWSIARKLGDSILRTNCNYDKSKLICEDSIQKIRSMDFIPEVPFIFNTSQNQLVDYYLHIYKDDIWSDDVSTSSDNGHDFWQNLSPEELDNIDNMMSD